RGLLQLPPGDEAATLSSGVDDRLVFAGAACSADRANILVGNIGAGAIQLADVSGQAPHCGERSGILLCGPALCEFSGMDSSRFADGVVVRLVRSFRALRTPVDGSADWHDRRVPLSSLCFLASSASQRKLRPLGTGGGVRWLGRYTVGEM